MATNIDNLSSAMDRTQTQAADAIKSMSAPDAGQKELFEGQFKLQQSNLAMEALSNVVKKDGDVKEQLLNNIK